VEYDPAIVWCGVGNAAIGERYIGELEGTKGQPDIDSELANALSCVMWCVWREWNSRSFEDCEFGLINLKKLVI
jgi:hypothetical protein